MILQAAVTDLKQLPATAGSRMNVMMNCQYAVRWVYDLVVLDPHEDEAKKMSLKLLELTLTLFDAMNVFQEEDSASTKATEVYHIALGNYIHVLILPCSIVLDLFLLSFVFNAAYYIRHDHV